jgi:hypothetical protein
MQNRSLPKNYKFLSNFIASSHYCLEAFGACGLSISYLVPKIEGQDMDFWTWDAHTSSECKWEFDSTPFCSEGWRDRVLMGLLYSCGFRNLLDILPKESKEELFNLVEEHKSGK